MAQKIFRVKTTKSCEQMIKYLYTHISYPLDSDMTGEGGGEIDTHFSSPSYAAVDRVWRALRYCSESSNSEAGAKNWKRKEQPESI